VNKNCSYIYTSEGVRLPSELIRVFVDGEWYAVRPTGKARTGEVTVKDLTEKAQRAQAGSASSGLVWRGFPVAVREDDEAEPVQGLHLDPARAKGRGGAKIAFDAETLENLPLAARRGLAMEMLRGG